MLAISIWSVIDTLSEYRITLRRAADLPLINVSAKRDKPIYVPAEICEIVPNQAYRGKLDSEQTAPLAPQIFPLAPLLTSLLLVNVEYWPPNAPQFPKLHSLCLSEVDIGPTALCAILQSCPTVEHLELERCDMEGPISGGTPGAQLPNLKFLSVHQVQFGLAH